MKSVLWHVNGILKTVIGGRKIKILSLGTCAIDTYCHYFTDRAEGLVGWSYKKSKKNSILKKGFSPIMIEVF